MATKKKTTKEVAAADPKKTYANTVVFGPRVTEKAAALSEKSMYTFNVAKDATKNEITKSIEALYNVVPIKVSVLNIKAKKVFRRGKWGTISSGRKAVVTLKKGDKIAFM